jgi:MFS family permease
MGMLGLAILLMLRDVGVSYGTAGLIAGMHSACLALFGPALARLIGRLGPVRVLPVLALSWGAALAFLILLATRDAPLAVLAACSAVAGAAFPPVAACVRTIWPAILPRSELRERSYAIDAAIVELVYLIGPVTVGFVATVGSGSIALGMVIALGCVGTLSFSATQPVRTWRPSSAWADPRDIALRPLRIPEVRMIVTTWCCLGVTWGGASLWITAMAEASGARGHAGAVIGIWAVGSIVGGAWAIRHPAGNDARRRLLRALAAYFLFLLPLLLVSNVWAAAPVLFLAGVLLAPAISSANIILSRVTPVAAITEAFAWTFSAGVAGGAIGTALAGVAVDHWGHLAAAALISTAAFVAWLAALRVALARKRTLVVESGAA